MFTAPAKWRVELRAKIGHYRNRCFDTQHSKISENILTDVNYWKFRATIWHPAFQNIWKHIDWCKLLEVQGNHLTPSIPKYLKHNDWCKLLEVQQDNLTPSLPKFLKTSLRIYKLFLAALQNISSPSYSCLKFKPFIIPWTKLVIGLSEHFALSLQHLTKSMQTSGVFAKVILYITTFKFLQLPCITHLQCKTCIRGSLPVEDNYWSPPCHHEGKSTAV